MFPNPISAAGSIRSKPCYLKCRGRAHAATYVVLTFRARTELHFYTPQKPSLLPLAEKEGPIDPLDTLGVVELARVRRYPASAENERWLRLETFFARQDELNLSRVT